MKIELKTAADVIKEGAEHDEQRRFLSEILHPKDSDHPTGVYLDRQHETVDIWWGGYEYSIPLKDIPSPRKLCEWICHICQKGWPMTSHERVVDLIHVVFHAKDWNLYSDGLQSRGTSADEERAKLTPQLRWKVLKRDGHRCRACGKGPEHGAVLHIDHITAIARGGLTEFPNLQTLCSSCNFGKRTT